MNEHEDLQQELEKVEEALAMANRAIQISRREQERLSQEPSAGPEGPDLNTADQP